MLFLLVVLPCPTLHLQKNEHLFKVLGNNLRVSVNYEDAESLPRATCEFSGARGGCDKRLADGMGTLD